MRPKITIRPSVVVALATAAGVAATGSAAQTSISDLMIRLYNEPGEFFLDEQSSERILDFSKPQTVEVCLDKGPHMVPLTVEYRGKSATVKGGNCIRFDAKEVVVSPADELESGWNLTGRFRTWPVEEQS